MSDPASKPWSIRDDESDGVESGDAVAFDSISADGAGFGSVAPDEGAWRWTRLASPYYSLGAFIPATIWTLWSLQSGDPTRAGNVGIATLCFIGIAILIIARLGHRAAVADLMRAVRQGVAANPNTSRTLASDLRPIWRAVEEHSSNIEARTAELLDAHRRMSMDLTLSAAQRRLNADIFAALPDPILVLDSYGRLIYANAAAEEAFGFELESTMRQPIESLAIRDEFLKAVRHAREADLRAAERRVEFSMSERYFCAHLVPMAHEARQPGEQGGHGLVILVRDITRERETSRKKSEFVAHVAHELRTPLSSIRAYVEMLVDGEAADEKTRAEYYEIIQTSAERLGRLIDNMLNISRIEAGTVRINKEPIAVSMVVKEACDMMRPSAEEKGLRLNEHLTPVMYRVLADRDLLYQSILNLISNAVKYTPTGGEVSVRMSANEEARTVRIEVQDTGVGIPKEDLPRMFQKFFRVEANKDVAKGTGLGLNLVKNIVETVHGGEITLASEAGKGSTFGMNLPLML